MDFQNWEWARAASGDEYVVKEARKLRVSVDGLAKLDEAMRRIDVGEARSGEMSKVRGDVYELRVDCDGTWYRLLFGKNGQKWVALVLLKKKRNQLDPKAIALALRRLKAHA